MTSSDSPTARATAHLLLAREIPEHGAPDAVAAGAEHVFSHLFCNLAQWVGTAGCGALFRRAVALAVPQHPVLRGVRFRQAAPHLDGLADNAREYGSQATVEAATAALISIITMLNGLIGEDIAMSLMKELPLGTLEITPVTTPGTVPALRRGEAAS